MPNQKFVERMKSHISSNINSLNEGISDDKLRRKCYKFEIKSFTLRFSMADKQKSKARKRIPRK